MLKKKWNWLDTVIVIIVALIIAVAVFFVFGLKPKAADDQKTQEYLITFEIPKDVKGTYDVLKPGDEVFITNADKSIGVIENVMELPHQKSVFNENTKSLEVTYNQDFTVTRVKVKASGYKNELGELLINDTQLLFRTEYYFETPEIRFMGFVYKVEVVNE